MIAKRKSELRRFYKEGLSRVDDRALFMILATSGLRLHEATGLTLKDVNFGKGMVIPNSDRVAIRGTKNTFVTFINSEAKRVLKKFLASRGISDDNRIFKEGFGKSGTTYRWHKASEKSGVETKPSDLRDWFCNELGKLGVADRYIDAFCGRVHRSILGRHYTDYSEQLLRGLN